MASWKDSESVSQYYRKSKPTVYSCLTVLLVSTISCLCGDAGVGNGSVEFALSCKLCSLSHW